MLVYSGPENTQDENLCCVFDDPFDLVFYRCFGAGAIYTGDCDLNKVNLGTVYSNFSGNVGTVQIPHHGSKHSFEIHSFSVFKPHLICPISYGTKNRYGHPAAEVVNKLSIVGHRPLLVSEQPTSVFVQEITISDE